MAALKRTLPGVKVVRKPMDLPSQTVLDAGEWNQLEAGRLGPFTSLKRQVIYMPEQVKLSPMTEDHLQWRMNPSQDMGPRQTGDFADQALLHEASHVKHGLPWHRQRRGEVLPSVAQGIARMDPDLANSRWARMVNETSTIPEVTADAEGMANAARIGRDPMVLPAEELKKLAILRALRARQSMLAATPHVREITPPVKTVRPQQGWLPEVVKPLASHGKK